MVLAKLPRLRLAAWHLGMLMIFTFSFLVVRQERLERYDPEEATKSIVGVVEKSFYDWRLKTRGTRPLTPKVGILAIDEKAIAKFGRWPFPRNTYAPVFQNLKSAGVKWLGLDVLFTEPENLPLAEALVPMGEVLQQSTSPTGVLDPRKFVEGIQKILAMSPGDMALGVAIKEFKNIVQAVAFIPPEDGESVDRDWKQAIKHIRQSSAQVVFRKGEHYAIKDNAVYPLINTPIIAGDKPILGSINNSPDSDGIVRATSLVEEIPHPLNTTKNVEKTFFPSLNLQLAARYLGRKIAITHSDHVEKISLVDDKNNSIDIPLTRGGGNLLLNHYGNHYSSEDIITPIRISLADAADNILPKDVPDILIMGPTTLGIDDKRPSPIDSVANGVEHHVAALANILQQDFLRKPPRFKVLELGLLVLTGALMCLLLSKSSALKSLFFLMTSHILMEFIDRRFLFGEGKIINLSIFHIQNIAIFCSMILYKFLVEEREKRKVKGAFQHYLNPDVINQLLDSPQGLKLGGEKRELTVFFSDVRGFTTISERLSPEALAGLLNDYFTPMTDIVLKSSGLLDKYIGDALMAVWGAPLTLQDHADRALHASLHMLDALDVLRDGWKNRQLPVIDIGCGINTGPMVVGNMGSHQRFDYTVLGDAVNLGSRLEGITKEYGVRVICSDSTRKALKKPDDFVLRELDWIKVKGKNEPVTIFEVMRVIAEGKEKAIQIKTLFEAGLQSYRKKNFVEAQTKMVQILQIAPNDGPAVTFMERCEYYSENPPPENWDGIWVMKSK